VAAAGVGLKVPVVDEELVGDTAGLSTVELDVGGGEAVVGGEVVVLGAGGEVVVLGVGGNVAVAQRELT